MADVKNQLDSLRKRIEAQNGTVIDNVEGEMELDDVDDNGNPRKGPVLVHASAMPEEVQRAQERLGIEASGAIVESALSQLAMALRPLSQTGRIVVAGAKHLEPSYLRSTSPRSGSVPRLIPVCHGR